MGQRIHAIFMYLNPLTFERSIVIGGKHDRLIPMGTRVTPKPLVPFGKVVGFNFLTIICARKVSVFAKRVRLHLRTIQDNELVHAAYGCLGPCGYCDSLGCVVSIVVGANWQVLIRHRQYQFGQTNTNTLYSRWTESQYQYQYLEIWDF